MAFDFEKKSKNKQPEKKKPAQNISAEQKSYRERAKVDEKRYRLAVSSGYWLCFSFRTAAARDSFAAAIGADGEYAFGDELRKACKVPSAQHKCFSQKREFVDRPALSVMDAIGNHETDGTLNGDALAMAAAFMDSFDRCGKGKFTSVYCSPHHVQVIFRDEDDMNRFVEDYGIGNPKDPYIDGDRAAKALGVA